MFQAEQARIVHALVERVTIGPEGADIRIRVEGLVGLVWELGATWQRCRVHWMRNGLAHVGKAQ